MSGPRSYRPVQLRGQAFRGWDAIRAGILSARQLRSKAWRRVFQGVYVDSSISLTHAMRCSIAVDFVLPPDAVVAGRSAAQLYGVDIGGADDDVQVLVSKWLPRAGRAGVAVRRSVVPETERNLLNGVTVTTPVRTCFDVARWEPVVEAVAWIDAMIAARVVTGDELVTYLHQRAAERPRPRGIRTSLVLAGLPFPKVQFVVVDEWGQFVARVDLAYDEYQIAIEYDGLWHVGSAQQMHEDRRRLSALAALGWTVIQVTSTRLRKDLPGVVAEIRASIRRRHRDVSNAVLVGLLGT